MSYTFVFNQQDGWWLKITTIEQLNEYWRIYDKMYEESLIHLKKTKEFRGGMEHATALDFSIGKYALGHKLTFEEAKVEILCDLKKAQYHALCDNGFVYINAKNGWNSVEMKTEQFVHKQTLEFPSFKNKKYEIKQFPMGTHFYLFIDGIQIRDGENLKWNSYEEAEEFAKQYV